MSEGRGHCYCLQQLYNTGCQRTVGSQDIPASSAPLGRLAGGSLNNGTNWSWPSALILHSSKYFALKHNKKKKNTKKPSISPQINRMPRQTNPILTDQDAIPQSVQSIYPGVTLMTADDLACTDCRWSGMQKWRPAVFIIASQAVVQAAVTPAIPASPSCRATQELHVNKLALLVLRYHGNWLIFW